MKALFVESIYDQSKFLPSDDKAEQLQAIYRKKSII